MTLLWLAHSYAESTSHRLRAGEPLTLRGFLAMLIQGISILLGAVLPFLALLIGWAVGLGLERAIAAAIWTSAAALVAIELIAALRLRRSGWPLLAQGLFGAFLGLGIVTLKLLLH